MPERLTVQLGDGSIEKVRELAGGERKVGAYLTRVIAWLWGIRDILEETPLEELAIGYEDITLEEVKELERKIDEMEARDKIVERRLSLLEALAAQAPREVQIELGQVLAQRRIEASQTPTEELERRHRENEESFQLLVERLEEKLEQRGRASEKAQENSSQHES